MAEQHLDYADVDSGFQEMGGEAMPQRSDRYFFVQPRRFCRFEADLVDRLSRDRVSGRISWKEPVGGSRDVPICTQQFQQIWREHDIAIFAAFALFNANEHALGINVVGPQGSHFGDAQAGGVSGHKNGPMLEVGNALEETRNLVGA